MRVKIAMAAGDVGDAHALQQHADFLLAVGDGTVQTLPDGDLVRVPDELLCAGLHDDDPTISNLVDYVYHDMPGYPAVHKNPDQRARQAHTTAVRAGVQARREHAREDRHGRR